MDNQYFTAISVKIASPKSWEAREQIWFLPGLTTISKSILLALDHRVNGDIYEKTGEPQAWISRDTIARMVGSGVTAVKSHLSVLLREHYIDVEHRKTDKGEFTSNRYTIRYDVIASRTITQTKKGRAARDLPGSARDLPGSARDLPPVASRPTVGRQAPTNSIPELENEHGTELQEVTALRHADEAKTNLQNGAPSLENAERSEAVDPVEDQSVPVRGREATTVPPAPPIPEPAPPTPIPPTPPTWCSKGCGKEALKGDPGRLCADHRAEKQHAAAHCMRASMLNDSGEAPEPPKQRKPEPCIKQCGKLAEPGSALCVECAKPKDCCEPGCPLPTFAGLDRCIDHQVAFDIAQKRHGSAA